MKEIPKIPYLRFAGNGANPNYAAVAHLLRIYAGHLGMRLEEMPRQDSLKNTPYESPKSKSIMGPFDIIWDLPVSLILPNPCLIFPGRQLAAPDLHCDWTDKGFPIPSIGNTHKNSVFPESGFDFSITEILDSKGEFSLSKIGKDGKIILSDWDILSFCADIIFRRADYLTSQKVPAREAICLGQWDYEFKLHEEPWVDRWLFRLLSLLPRLEKSSADLPKQSKIWLTHDIDNLSKWRMRSIAGQILRTPSQLLAGKIEKVAQAGKEIGQRIFLGKDPYDNLDQIMQMEWGHKSTIFFLVNSKDHLLKRYDLEKPRHLKSLNEVKKRGMDIGLHGQVEFISDLEKIEAEVRKLKNLAGMDIYLNRQHYLRWDPFKTFNCLIKAGIKIDTTLGYNDTPGFRTGTSLPFFWFDCSTNLPTLLLEVPLILGEFQFYDPQNFNFEDVKNSIEHYSQRCKQYGGVFTTLFHNNYFYEKDFAGQKEVYLYLLDHSARLGMEDFNPQESYKYYLGLNV